MSDSRGALRRSEWRHLQASVREEPTNLQNVGARRGFYSAAGQHEERTPLVHILLTLNQNEQLEGYLVCVVERCPKLCQNEV